MDSHNLGKTLLTHLIDFLFLKQIASSEHFLERHKDRFASFIFFMEIALNSGDYVTTRRSVENNTRISFKRHEEQSQDLVGAADEEWDHRDVPLERAVELVDAYLDLSVLKPWNYRKGLSYFLRTQDDYRDVLQVQKFVRGRDADWKPFVAHLFGLDHHAVERKYELDGTIEEVAKHRQIRQAEVQASEHDLTRLATQIDIRRAEVDELSQKLDAFDFHEEERRIIKDLVEQVEQRIADINNALYNIDSDIVRIQRAITKGFKFNLAEIERVFEESQVTLPESLTRSYEELAEFNKRLSAERNAALRGRAKELRAEREALADEHAALDQKRRAYLRVIRGADTFDKFKALQRELTEQKAELTYLDGQYEKLQAVAKLSAQIDDLERERSKAVAEIKTCLHRGSQIQKRVALEFNNFVRRLLDCNAQFYITQNKQGNLEFQIETELRGSEGKLSSQSEGKSYKQLICALFDLALLKVYEKAPFYHFVYHDGVLEGLDNRKKIAFLEIVEEVISNRRIQYILSAIDTDLPRDDEDQKIPFSSDEIVLALHDEGDEGRLFKMPEF